MVSLHLVLGIPAPGTWFLYVVYSISLHLVLDAWYLRPGTLGFVHLVYGILHMVIGTWFLCLNHTCYLCNWYLWNRSLHLVLCAWYLVSGIRYPCTWFLVSLQYRTLYPGTCDIHLCNWYLVLSTWYLVYGIPAPASWFLCNIVLCILVHLVSLHLVSLNGDGNGEKDASSEAKMTTALSDVVNQHRVARDP